MVGIHNIIHLFVMVTEIEREYSRSKLSNWCDIKEHIKRRRPFCAIILRLYEFI